MKKTLYLIILLFSISPLKAIEITGVLQDYFISSENSQLKNICMLVIEIENEQTIGIIEDIYDCYWTRKYKKEIGNKIEIVLEDHYFEFMSNEEKQSLSLIPEVNYIYIDYE